VNEQPRPSCICCGAQQHDWLPCARCTENLREDLRRIPDLWNDLQDTMTGQVSMGPGGKVSEIPMPYKERAVKASRYVKNQLVTEARDLDMGDLQQAGDTVESLAAWLLARVERIRSSHQADEIIEQMAYCVEIMLPIVDRPADLMFCGRCSTCGGDLYSRRGRVTDLCRKCKQAGVDTEYDPVARRDAIRQAVEDRLGTVSECALILLNFGLVVKVETIRDWTRYRLAAHGTNQAGHNLYRFGDVMDLARERKAEMQARAAQIARRG
jgi:hypothetical protein